MIEVRNPASGETIGTVADQPPEEVHAMAERARGVQPAWQALGFAGRGRILRRAQRWLIDNADRVVRTIVAETGKPYEDAQIAELSYAASSFGFWAKHAADYLADERVRSANPFVLGRRLLVRYQPVGLVGVIGPWNFPLVNSFGDCIPALAAGNATILKPSHLTPLTSLLMAEMLAQCGVPDGVFQVATGQATTAAALIDVADFVQFTGSTETGRRVMARAAWTLTPVSLELGGKDAMIVLADADLERAANAATYYGLANSGQVCISVERIYVEEPVYEEFVAAVTERVGRLRQGPPRGPGSVEVGAIASPAQLATIDAHVREAASKGARVLTGGRVVPGPGDFYEPTVLADVDHTMRAMMQETFGPTLPIMRVRDVEQAIALANDSPYGLAASVWTSDRALGERIARRLQAGAVCVNDAQLNYVALELPMGGWKASGIGSRHGRDGIRKYCARQSLLITRLAPWRELHMFPYGRRTSRLFAALFRLLYGRGRRP